MDRNVESHFSSLPDIEIQRSVMKRPYNIKFSGNVGDLIPFYIDEILPGDTFQVDTSIVARFQTLLTPVMDNSYMDVYYFYVPLRLLWEHYREFYGENTQSAWIPEVEYSIPVIKSPENGFAVGTIADYLGIPPGLTWNETDRGAPSALPFRGYALICNEFFRDQNLTDPLHIPTGDANQQGSNGDNYRMDVANGGKPFRVAKFHDYFTSCLPSPQKGNAVTLPLGTSAPVFAGEDHAFPTDYTMHFKTTDGTPITGSQHPLVLTGSSVTDQWAYTRIARGTSTSGSDWISVTPSNLYADLAQATAATVNDLRLAFQLQKFYERAARSGSRYIEFLRGQFGVDSGDARVQRPEYLGGKRIPLSVHQVANTAQSGSDFLGDVGALSVTGDSDHSFVKSFTEPGYVFGLCCVRYDHTYSQGIERFWTRKRLTEFFLPVFSNLGEQPVFKSEIYADGNMQDQVFGYQECWGDYRYKPSRLAGEMRLGIPNTLGSWHLGDYYSQSPSLSDEWIREDKTNVDRVLAVTSQVSNQFWCDIALDMTCTRPMPMYSIPGLIDHN